MAMNIKNDEAHSLARELAALEHTTVTDAVTMSLREALERRRTPAAQQRRRARVEQLVERLQRQAKQHEGNTLWDIADDLYNERGLPR